MKESDKSQQEDVRIKKVKLKQFYLEDEFVVSQQWLEEMKESDESQQSEEMNEVDELEEYDLCSIQSEDNQKQNFEKTRIVIDITNTDSE